jgi:ADP-ribose pyrophosphatase YjhB (NUDIX family)
MPPRQKPLSAEKFQEIYSQVPRLCIDLIIRKEGGIILTKRSLPTWHGLWHLPGSTLHYQERIADAARRIAKEETGVDIAIVKTLGYIEFLSSLKERGYGQDISIAILADYTGGEMHEKTDEASALGVFNELPEEIVGEHVEFLKAHWTEIFPAN